MPSSGVVPTTTTGASVVEGVSSGALAPAAAEAGAAAAAEAEAGTPAAGSACAHAPIDMLASALPNPSVMPARRLKPRPGFPRRTRDEIFIILSPAESTLSSDAAAWRHT
jgi:hypothetical protein